MLVDSMYSLSLTLLKSCEMPRIIKFSLLGSAPEIQVEHHCVGIAFGGYSASWK